jgi:hypothetical protein
MLCIAYTPTVKSQFVPNGGFEEWETRELYQKPESWNTSNMEALIHSTQTALLTEDSYDGNYALRLESAVSESVVSGTDTIFGYATCNGTVIEGDSSILEFTGGIPVSGIPDSIFGYFKYDLPENDTAIVLVSFKLNDSIISQNIFPLTGSQSSYTMMGWEIETLSEIPDTAFIGITSTNPFNPMPGGWVQADSLWFNGINDSIPNSGFEVWEAEEYYDPADHLTANLITHFFGGDTSATRITDAHSGDYAISIKAVETSIPGDSGMTDIVASFLIPYGNGEYNLEDIPTFPVDFNPSQLTGFYKFTPAVNDTAIAYVILKDDEDGEYEFGVPLLEASEYTEFTINFTYPIGTTITEVGYVFSTTLYFGIGDGGSGEPGSELILDDLDLVDPCADFDEFTISVTDPTCEENYSVLDAGAEWDGYEWSTDETTQTIQAIDGTFSVIVTDSTTGCQFSDEATVSSLICDKINQVSPQTAVTKLFPNPSDGVFQVELTNILPGEYAVEIISITGKTLKKQNAHITSETHKLQFDLTSYPHGLYMVKIEGAGYSHYERLLLK